MYHILLRAALVWDFTQHRMVIAYRRFGKTYPKHRYEITFLRA